MITALDSNVLFDVLSPEPNRASSASALVLDAHQVGDVVIAEPVFAEVSSRFVSTDEFLTYLRAMGIGLLPSAARTLYLAGREWRLYTSRRRSGQQCQTCGTVQSVTCANCGANLLSRQHLPSDFIIGAHASLQADRLLTRDKGLFRTYFPDLELV